MELIALLAACIFIGLSSGQDVQVHYGQTQSHYENTFYHGVGEELHFEFPVHRKLCTVTFTPSDGNEMVIIRNGYLSGTYFGMRLQLQEAKGSDISVVIEDLEVKDSGFFQIVDRNHNVAMRVHLEVAASASAWVNAGWAASIVSIVVSCCCCLKRCFCKKSSKSSEEVAEPTENPLDLQQYMAEPRPPSYHREPIPPLNVGHAYAYHPADPGPSAVEMHGPASLPFTAHPAQMHSPASLPFTAPPAQAPATGGQGAAQDVSLASNFLSSETDPCFEMKGMNLPPPLYSECATADVYTSDKLNFSFL